jgi:hypothetical protein
MRKVLILSSVIGIMILCSCGGHPKHNPASLTLKFNPMFGSNVLRLGNTYETPAPYAQYFNFSELRLFLSHIKLVRADASTVEVNPVVYISLDDSTTYNIPLGDSLGSFTAIRFSIGLDSTQDNYAPGTNPDPSYTLNENVVQNNMFWGLTQKYVFVKMDVEVDSISSLTQSDGLGYHIGTPPYYTTVTLNFNQALNVSATGQSVITLTTDFQKIFTGVNGINPMVQHGTMTSGNNDTLALQFMSNLSQSFSLQ